MRLRHAEEVALVTDLSELTMAQAYLHAGEAHEMATFSLFVRKYPPHRGSFVASGLEDVVRDLEGWRCSPTAIDTLHRTGRFAEDVLDYLIGLGSGVHRTCCMVVRYALRRGFEQPASERDVGAALKSHQRQGECYDRTISRTHECPCRAQGVRTPLCDVV